MDVTFRVSHREALLLPRILLQHNIRSLFELDPCTYKFGTLNRATEIRSNDVAERVLTQIYRPTDRYA
jgi:hypothetical protein